MKTYKIGTRGSLLAVTQSTLIKNQLEQLSQDKFELVLIKTQGDEITSKPLWQLEGKDFFTKELFYHSWFSKF
jgi:hydroxymethylbilane synthase